jgi:ABC-2 type transport system ATP-binding protein
LTTIKALAAVASVESVKRGELVEITAFPRKNTLLIEEVSALAVREKWDVRELRAESGRLDEVFRSITTHDAARSRASAA